MTADSLRRPPESWALLEGPKFIETALKGWARPLALVLRSGSAAPRGAFPQTLEIQSKKFEALSNVRNSQGSIGVFDVGGAPQAQEILARGGRTWILLQGVQDPGNVGTLIRTAAALGASGFFADRASASPFQDKALRASAGLALVLPCARVERAEDFLEEAGRAGIQRVAAAAHGPAGEGGRMILGREHEARSLILVLGSEGSGLEPGVQARCDRTWTLPLEKGAESLNVAVAAALFLEARRHGQS